MELEALYAQAASSKKLLVVAYTMESLPNTAKHYEVLRELSSKSPHVQFVSVMADKAEDLKQVSGKKFATRSLESEARAAEPQNG